MSVLKVIGSLVVTTRANGSVTTETFPFELNPHATFGDIIKAQAAMNKIAGDYLKFEIMTDRRGPKAVSNA